MKAIMHYFPPVVYYVVNLTLTTLKEIVNCLNQTER